MYKIDDEALSASSSTPGSFPHYAKLVDLSSFARKGIKSQKMERIEESQQKADHIGELVMNAAHLQLIYFVFQMGGFLNGSTRSNGSKLTWVQRLLSMELSWQDPQKPKPT